MSDAAILVVDDNTTQREQVVEILRDCGHTVTAVGDGRAALAHVAAQSCDLILASMRMAALSGVGMLRALQRHGPHPPVIFLTGYASPGEAMVAVQAGASGYLMRPIDGNGLRALAAAASLAAGGRGGPAAP